MSNFITIIPDKRIFQPLELVEAEIDGLSGMGTLVVEDGEGKEYIHSQAPGKLRFRIGGALGTHRISCLDSAGRELDTLKFRVECETGVRDEKGEFGELLQMLHYTMIHWNEEHNCLYQGKIYQYFVRWLRDHVHTLKGMKYFHRELKSALELYRDTQREDGMIFDNVYPRIDKKAGYWDQRFTYGGFIRASDDETLEFKRIPVENDVEYLFVEGIYYTWKATGDDEWMKGMLDSATRAYQYTLSNPWRWSEKYKLLKRGYTIDTWDFQSDFEENAARDAMAIDQNTCFGVMHGDNTGFIAGCRYLSEMLEAAGRKEEAPVYAGMAEEMKQRLDQLAWNGSFYTHHVPERENSKRDFGVDTAQQLSLSNTYALNRGIGQEQKESIIRRYLHIKEHLPQGSPGEWYTIYPPFERGFGGHNDKWQYMNGGVITIAAGELAHGAFDSGFEKYGADILRRVHALAKANDGFLPCCFTGAVPEAPEARFTTLELSEYANVDVCGKGAEGVPGWTQEGENDLHEMVSGSRTFENVPFEIPVPERNGRRACIGLRNRPGYAHRIEIPLKGTARSIYLLHTMSGGDLAGSCTLQYEDGTSHSRYIVRGKEIQGWWFPEEDQGWKKNYVVAWEGRNAVCERVGVVLSGLENPYPQKRIEKIIFEEAKDGGFWAIFGLTLSDQGVRLRSGRISFGIPDNWGAAAVVYALIEGLSGVTDQATAFRKTMVSPRWCAAGVHACETSVRYPAGDGYVSYAYRHIAGEKRIHMFVTGNGASVQMHCLLPEGIQDIQGVWVNKTPCSFELKRIQASTYVDFEWRRGGADEVEIRYGDR